MTPFAAVIGAGEIGGATAQAIAALDCVREVRLIDGAPGVASGKALDMMQSGATDAHSSVVIGAQDVTSASGAVAIVLADPFGTSPREWPGDEALALVRRIWDLAATDRSVLVCAGAGGPALIRTAVRELNVDRRRILGSAPAAFESAARAMVGIALDGDGSRVALMVLGDLPSSAVPCWSQATVAGAALTSLLPAAQLNAIDTRLPKLWPPGPYTLASAAARAVQAIAIGSRTELTMAVLLDGEMKMRNVVAAMPVRLGPGGVQRIVEPELTPHELVRLVSGFRV